MFAIEIIMNYGCWVSKAIILNNLGGTVYENNIPIQQKDKSFRPTKTVGEYEDRKRA
jgi:hypothetical protein